jgi:hypothetical protein
VIRLSPLLLLLSVACATARTYSPPEPMPVDVLSYNRQEVDVYSVCGDRDVTWLGVVGKLGAASFSLPAVTARCVRGVRFFLVVRDAGRGYWVGPLRARSGERIDLVIEKYAGLSTARSSIVRGTGRMPR